MGTDGNTLLRSWYEDLTAGVVPPAGPGWEAHEQGPKVLEPSYPDTKGGGPGKGGRKDSLGSTLKGLWRAE